MLRSLRSPLAMVAAAVAALAAFAAAYAIAHSSGAGTIGASGPAIAPLTLGGAAPSVPALPGPSRPPTLHTPPPVHVAPVAPSPGRTLAPVAPAPAPSRGGGGGGGGGGVTLVG